MEKQLNSCKYLDSYTCGHHKDAGVVCPSACEDRDVRLVNFTQSYSGRVEMCYKGDWVSLCLDGWSNEEAQVICQQIGSFKQGSLRRSTLYACMYIWMDGWMDGCMYVCIYVCTHTHTHTHGQTGQMD